MRADHQEMLRAALNELGSCDVKVEGASMWPFIQPGNTVTVCRCSKKPLLGTVVAFLNQGRLIVHRVVWRRKGCSEGWNVWVHGDSSPFSCTRIESEEIIGTVTRLRDRGRFSQLWLAFPMRVLAIPIGILLQIFVAAKAGLSTRS